MLIDTNHIPEMTDTTHSLYRRLRVMKWTEQITEEEREGTGRTLRSDLSRELEGILAWIIQGAKSYYEVGLPESASSCFFNGVELPRSSTGEQLMGKESLIAAGLSGAPWWNSWLANSQARNHVSTLDRYMRFVTPTGRLHPVITPAKVTGRTHASEPSVQNLPKGEEFRSLLRARPDHLTLSIDFSAIELRIGAVLAIRAARDVERIMRGQVKEGEEARLRWILPALEPLVNSPESLSFPVEVVHGNMDDSVNQIHQSLRLAAYRVITRGETTMATLFRRGSDPHFVTALDFARRSGKLAFQGSSIEWLAVQVSDEKIRLRKEFNRERQAAKACNFGLLCGMSAQSLHRRGQVDYQLDWTLEEASKARMAWFDLYPDLKLWQLWTTYFKRTRQPESRYLTWDEQPKQPEVAERPLYIYEVSTLASRKFAVLGDRRAALSYQNQGTGADILARSIMYLPHDVAAMFILPVHDELVFEVPLCEVELACPILYAVG